MRSRYLAAISARRTDLDTVMTRMASCPWLKMVGSRRPLLLFASGPLQPLGHQGWIIGRLFERASAAGCQAAPEHAPVTKGLSLIDDCWGGYVALTTSNNRVSILRAPLGNLPCYWHQQDGLILAASDVSSLIAGGMARPSIDTASLARHIAAEDLHRRETCLSGIWELQGGERLTIDGAGVDRETLWSPWQFAAREAAIADQQQAAELVRGAAVRAVSDQASAFRSPILKLSGGLDSSIVAACLAERGRPFICLNLVTEHPAGDERHYARRVAMYLGAPLIERFRRIADVELERSAAARLPRPSARAFTQASAALASEVAAATGSDALFDGGGGDNVFCSLQSARPLLDCLRGRNGRPHFWRTTRSIASLAQVSLWAVMKSAARISARGSKAYQWNVDARFLSAEAVAATEGWRAHPWLDPPAGSLPGKIAHVALITAAQSVVEGTDVEDGIPLCSPLISQPLVEACLRVPSWLWFEDGHNRFVARSAFRDQLPVDVLDRDSKGAPDCFVADLYDANRSKIRELLLGGLLRREKLLDDKAVDAALDNQAPVEGHGFLRLMRLVDAETWARSWS